VKPAWPNRLRGHRYRHVDLGAPETLMAMALKSQKIAQRIYRFRWCEIRGGARTVAHDHGEQARTHCRRGRFGAGEDLESAAHGVLHSVLKNIASLRWSELYSSANTLCRGTRRIAGEACELQIHGATGRDARWHCLVRRRVNFGTRKVPNFRVRLGAKRNNSELL
jgi:hypothetical protein